MVTIAFYPLLFGRETLTRYSMLHFIPCTCIKTAMRDFQASFGPRSYELPDFGDILSLTDKWNMLIDTSYKFFKTNQCPDTGLVPNWALVQEKNYDSLQSYPGSFSGSGTPQKEFGAEASRTFWRTSFDAIAYPNEAASQALPFLSPLQNKLVENFDPSPLDGWSFFAQSAVSQNTFLLVSKIFNLLSMLTNLHLSMPIIGPVFHLEFRLIESCPAVHLT